MRLDKFLKISRLVKRRTLAHDLCVAGGVELNGKTAKPASEVSEGDTLVLRLGPRMLTVTVARIPQGAVPAQQAASLYTVTTDLYHGHVHN